MSRHSLSLSPEQLTAFDLDAFVAHAEALNLYQHTVLPLPPLTQFEVGGIAFRGMEGGITQNNHALFNLPNQPLKGIVGDIGRGTCPISANLPLCPRAPRLLHAAFCCLSGHAQARWASQVRTVDS